MAPEVAWKTVGRGWPSKLEAVRPLARGVTLAEIEVGRAFASHPLVRQPRLSMLPGAKQQFERIEALARRGAAG